MSEKQLKVQCPTCKKKFNYYSSDFRPFCDERCKLIDMGQWLSETYTIEGRTNSVYIEQAEALQHLIDETDEIY